MIRRAFFAIQAVFWVFLTNIAAAENSAFLIELPDEHVDRGLMRPGQPVPVQLVTFSPAAFDPTSYSALGEKCGFDLAVQLKLPAMIRVDVVAPCSAHDQVLVDDGTFRHHLNLAFDGTGTLSFPAMSDQVKLRVVAGEHRETRSVEVMDFADIVRVALKSSAASGLKLRAEGAHTVWTSLDATVQVVTAEPHMVSQKGPTLRMSLLQKARRDSCATATDAALFIKEPGYLAQERLIRLRPLGCGDLGTRKVLRTVIPDMKVAQN